MVDEDDLLYNKGTFSMYAGDVEALKEDWTVVKESHYNLELVDDYLILEKDK